LNIKIGKISEKDLVNKFASKSVKKTYKEKGKFTSSNKKHLLEKINQYCIINDLGNREYEITEIYKIPKPASLSKLQSGLYQYMAPIILIKLLKEHDENNKIILPLMDYARHIEMINHNYKPVKYNQDEFSISLDINKLVFREFFEKVDDNIKYYIQRCLEYLQSADVLKWYKVPMVKKKKIINVYIDQKGNPVVEGEFENVRATPEEVKYFNEVSELARVSLDIKSKPECFYGKKAFQFCKIVTEKLKEKGIMYFYDGYEIYYTNIDRCNTLLKEFKDCDNEHELIKRFNEEFINLIMDNAEKRQLKVEIYNQYRKEGNYIANFKTLSELTIDNKAEKIKLKYKYKDKEADILNQVDNDFHINVTKKIGDKIIKKQI